MVIGGGGGGGGGGEGDPHWLVAVQSTFLDVVNPFNGPRNRKTNKSYPTNSRFSAPTGVGA